MTTTIIALKSSNGSKEMEKIIKQNFQRNNRVKWYKWIEKIKSENSSTLVWPKPIL